MAGMGRNRSVELRHRRQTVAVRRDKRQPKAVVGVAFDGERTEAEYFAGWRKRLGIANVSIMPFLVRSGGNALKAVRETKRLRDREGPFDELWCVCDCDDTAPEDVKQAVDQAARSSINLALSSRSFEVWLACHWAKISTACISCEADAVGLVQKFHAEYGAPSKTIPFSVLEPRTLDACANATWLSAQGCDNPSTNVHHLVSKLVSYLK